MNSNTSSTNTRSLRPRARPPPLAPRRGRPRSVAPRPQSPDSPTYSPPRESEAFTPTSPASPAAPGRAPDSPATSPARYATPSPTASPVRYTPPSPTDSPARRAPPPAKRSRDREDPALQRIDPRYPWGVHITIECAAHPWFKASTKNIGAIGDRTIFPHSGPGGCTDALLMGDECPCGVAPRWRVSQRLWVPADGTPARGEAGSAPAPGRWAQLVCAGVVIAAWAERPAGHEALAGHEHAARLAAECLVRNCRLFFSHLAGHLLATAADGEAVGFFDLFWDAERDAAAEGAFDGPTPRLGFWALREWLGRVTGIHLDLILDS